MWGHVTERGQGCESRTNKTLNSIHQLIFHKLFQSNCIHEKLKTLSIQNTLTHNFGDPETFQIESKIGVEMIPKSFSTIV